jgi:intracellular multiplication protein IcmT
VYRPSPGRTVRYGYLDLAPAERVQAFSHGILEQPLEEGRITEEAVRTEPKMCSMWCNTMQPIRIYVAGARALIPVMLVLTHIRMWTFYLAIVGIVVFAVLEWFGLTFPAAIRTPLVEPPGTSSFVDPDRIRSSGSRPLACVSG